MAWTEQVWSWNYAHESLRQGVNRFGKFDVTFSGFVHIADIMEWFNWIFILPLNYISDSIVTM